MEGCAPTIGPQLTPCLPRPGHALSPRKALEMQAQLPVVSGSMQSAAVAMRWPTARLMRGRGFRGGRENMVQRRTRTLRTSHKSKYLAIAFFLPQLIRDPVSNQTASLTTSNAVATSEGDASGRCSRSDFLDCRSPRIEANRLSS